MSTVLITHLAPHEEDEVQFLVDLACALEARGLRPLIWSTSYDLRFSRWYLPLAWRLNRLPEFYTDLQDSAPLPIGVEGPVWLPRIAALVKQEWKDVSTEAPCRLHELANLSARIIALFDVQLILSWNTLCPHTGMAAAHCRATGRQAWLLERAVFPQTWFVEPGGLVGHSTLSGVSLEALEQSRDPTELAEIGRRYLAETSFAEYNRYTQIDVSPEMERLRNAPHGARRPRVAFFPPDDGSLGFLPADHADRKATLPHFETSFDAARALAQAHDGITIFKPHPSFIGRHYDLTDCPDLHVIDYDFREVMAWADVVATTGSGLAFVALAMGKPLILMGNDPLSGKGIAYEAQNPEDLGKALEYARQQKDLAERLERFYRYCGLLATELLARPESVRGKARRPIDVAAELADAIGTAGDALSDAEFAARRDSLLTPTWQQKLARDGQLAAAPITSSEVELIESPEALEDTLHNAAPEHLVLDFDHTLILDNSTERFLRSTRPQTLVFLVAMASDLFVRAVGAVGYCKPDRWRDFMRVTLVTAVLPWSWPWWVFRARRRMASMVNARLVQAVQESGARDITIISFGMAHLIRPLLGSLPFEARLLACRAFPKPVNLRKSGKAAAILETVPAETLKKGVFVTDSREDAELFPLMGKTFLIEWAPYTPKAFERLYLPMRYAVQGKYSRRRYFLNQIVKEDILILLLAYAFTPLNAVALLLLFGSFYAIYELGYYANDHCAAKNEETPTLSKDAQRFMQVRLGARPWIWAAVLGFPGVALALWPDTMDALNGVPGGLERLLAGAALWMGVLVATENTFHLFNSLRPSRRIFVFPFLHGFKNFAFAALLPLTGLGAILLTAQVLTQTTNYLIYRMGGDISRFNRQGWRFALFGIITLLSGPMALVQAPVQVGLIGAWSTLRTLERSYRRSVERVIVEKLIKVARSRR